MRVIKAKYNIGEPICCRDRRIRGHKVPRGTIGSIVHSPFRITGDFLGYYHVEIPGVPGTAIIAEGLLYRPRKRK